MPGKIEPPFYPIIYVRGYAGTEAEVEDTVADPYMGFNLGATKVRQLWTSEIRRYYFESPLVRLMKDFDYRDVYSGGSEMPSDVELGGKSIIIYRYYDDASKHLGTGKRSEIEHYAKGLAKLILDVRKRICGDDAEASRKFKVYLVAHSMGGLVCRCFLQNSAAELDEPRSMVDKVFTYATPHNGIDFEVIGNVPGFFSINNVDNFNREKMAKYLGLKGKPENVATLDGKFDPDRLFCLVGTNAQDYDAARGLSRRLVGPVSDGLVRIENAVVSGPVKVGSKTEIRHAPRAFVYRSHSGHFGIVNSEEGYQNLVRFLFGDVRVDGTLQVDKLTLPPKIERERKNGHKIRASYHFEVAGRVRGQYWDLHRRLTAENSAIFRSYDALTDPSGARHLICSRPFSRRGPGSTSAGRPWASASISACRCRNTRLMTFFGWTTTTRAAISFGTRSIST
jgi:PGAP1-like protein